MTQAVSLSIRSLSALLGLRDTGASLHNGRSRPSLAYATPVHPCTMVALGLPWPTRHRCIGFPGVVGGDMVFAKLGGRHAGSYRLPGDHIGSHCFDAKTRSTTTLAGCRWRRGGNERPTGHTAVVQIGQVNGTNIETDEKSPA
jgi:hypothetical protein